MMVRPTSECEMDPDHLYHDHREAAALRAKLELEIERLRHEVDYWMNLDAAALDTEIERLHDALELALGELSRTDLSDRDARRGAWTLIDAALTDDSPVVEGPSDGFMNDDGSYGDRLLGED